MSVDIIIIIVDKQTITINLTLNRMSACRSTIFLIYISDPRVTMLVPR